MVPASLTMPIKHKKNKILKMTKEIYYIYLSKTGYTL